jgi:hypothetical protein
MILNLCFCNIFELLVLCFCSSQNDRKCDLVIPVQLFVLLNLNVGIDSSFFNFQKDIKIKISKSQILGFYMASKTKFFLIAVQLVKYLIYYFKLVNI